MAWTLDFRARPSRVLMTTDTVGGVWTYALELASALRPFGIETVLASMGDEPTSAQRHAALQIPGLQLRVSKFKLEWQPDPWADLARAADWLLELEDEVRPDVVHLNGYCHGDLPWRAPAIVVGHSCVRSWFRAVRGTEAPPAWDRYAQAVAAGLAGAEVVVAPTQAMLSVLSALYGPFDRSRVVPNGIALETCRSMPEEPFVLAAGRLWDEAKNLALLAEVGPRVSWPVRVAGETASPDGRVRHADGVLLLGRLELQDLRALMSRAGVFVHPARYEPFGLAPLEAAASGCALILGDVPSLREVWGDAALYAAPDDPDAFVYAIERLAQDDLLRRGLQVRARERSRRYPSSAMAGGYIALYRSIIAPRAPRDASQAV